MSESSEQMTHRIADLLESNTPIVLFVGKSYGNLSPSLYKQPWSCIITSTTDNNFAYNFEIMDKRLPIPIGNYEDMLDKAALNQKELNIIYLYGIDNKREEKLSFREYQLKKSDAEKMINLIPQLLKGNFGSLFIVGYDPNHPDEVDISVLYNVIVQMRKGSAFLFDATEIMSENPYISDLLQHSQLQVFSEDLSKILEAKEAVEIYDDGNIYYTLQDTDSVALYINKKRVILGRKKLFDTSGFVRLLSESEVGDTRCPPHLKAEYFYSFLKESVRRPIWFGYENGLNLRREFESQLENVVKSALSTAKESIERQSILLVGQTSSSKTIALGALAYKIYCEKEYPVIFINNPDLNLEQGSPNFNGLDMLLQHLEELGARKILLIWDNSSSLSQIRESRKLQTALVNRGRKVVLVSSAYEQPNSYYNGFETIKADIALIPRELHELQEKIVNYCDIPAADYNKWVKRNEESNLLTLLYTFLYSYIHSEISSGLQQEIKWGMDKLLPRIEHITEQEKNHLTDIAVAFQNSGYTLSNFIGEEDSIDKKLKVINGMLDFCNTVATSYQMKIPLPLSMALRSIDLPMDNYFAGIQDALFEVPFLQIISPELDEASFDYLVAFRTPLEASLYLKGAGVTPEQQIDYIVKMIEDISISGEYKKYSETATIEKLIRVIGPNCPDLEQKRWNYVYKPYYSRIIDALTELRVNQCVNEPRLICQEVAWMREVYGVNGSVGGFSFEERKAKIQQAIEISRKTMQELERPLLSRRNKVTKNNLIVESALSELKLYDLYKETNSLKTIKAPSVIFDYREISQQLNEVIASDPTNTYPYNALLRLFKAVYNSDNASEENKIRYLSNITSVIDDVESQGREVEKNEEYREYKTEILSFVSEEKYREYYDALIRQGSASGVHLRARKMLSDSGIDYKKSFENDTQNTKAQEIVNFLKDNMSVVQNHAGCLYMLLSLVWLLYNREPVFSGKEQQFTFMDANQWQEINSLCVLYETQFLRGDVKPFNAPTMYYLLALSSAQLDDFQRSLDFFSKINETMFYTQIRTKVWHILCEKDGTPKKFKGTIEERKYDPIRKKGKVYIEKISAFRGGIFFYGPNLHLNEIKGMRSDFEIGTSFIGCAEIRQ